MVNPVNEPAAEGRLLWSLVRSMARLPWATTLWGVQQAANLMLPGRTGYRTVTAFDAMSRTASEHMGETVSSVYRTGEHLQTSLIETVSALASRGTAAPRAALGEAWTALVHPWVRSRARDPEEEG